jgi:hypothetical protein
MSTKKLEFFETPLYIGDMDEGYGQNMATIFLPNMVTLGNFSKKILSTNASFLGVKK